MSDGWYIKTSESEHGPISLARLQLLVHSGEVTGSDFVRRGSSGIWQSAAAVDELDYEVGSLDRQRQWHCRLKTDEYGPLSTDELRSLCRRSESDGEVFVRLSSQGTWIRYRSLSELFSAADGSPTAEPASSGRAEFVAGDSATCAAEQAAELNLTTVGESVESVPTDSGVARAPVNRDGRITRVQSLARRGLESASRHRVLMAVLAGWMLINVAVLGFSRGGGLPAAGPNFAPKDIDEEFRHAYETYVTIWYEVKRLRTRGVTDQEWNTFSQETRSSLRPLLVRLRDSGNPAKVYLFRTGDSLLMRLLGNPQSARASLEPLLEKHLRTARRALQASGTAEGKNPHTSHVRVPTAANSA